MRDTTHACLQAMCLHQKISGEATHCALSLSSVRTRQILEWNLEKQPETFSTKAGPVMHCSPLVTHTVRPWFISYLSQLDEDDFCTKLKAEEAKLKSLLPRDHEEEGEGGETTAAAGSGPEQAGEVAKQMAVVQYLRVGTLSVSDPTLVCCCQNSAWVMQSWIY